MKQRQCIKRKQNLTDKPQMLAKRTVKQTADTCSYSKSSTLKVTFKVLLIMLTLIENGASSSVSMHDELKSVKKYCERDMDECRPPQSAAEISWSNFCFPNMCWTGHAICVTDTITDAMHYICQTVAEITSCKPGFHGKFHYDENTKKIKFEKSACPEGTYTKGIHDCRNPCIKHGIPDENKYTIIQPGSKTGDPAVVECRRGIFCPTNPKFGTRFLYNDTLSREHVDVCQEIGKNKAPCLLENSRVQTSTPRNRITITATISHSPESRTQVSVMPQKEKRGSLLNDTHPPSTTQFDNDHKPSTKVIRKDLTNGQVVIIISAVFAVLAGLGGIACVCWCCYKTKCTARKKRPESVEDGELEKKSQESMTTTNINTGNYWKINIGEVKLDRKSVNTDTSSTDTEETADEDDEVSSEVNEITEKEPLFGKTDPLDQV